MVHWGEKTLQVSRKKIKEIGCGPGGAYTTSMPRSSRSLCNVEDGARAMKSMITAAFLLNSLVYNPTANIWDILGKLLSLKLLLWPQYVTQSERKISQVLVNSAKILLQLNLPHWHKVTYEASQRGCLWGTWVRCGAACCKGKGMPHVAWGKDI